MFPVLVNVTLAIGGLQEAHQCFIACMLSRPQTAQTKPYGPMAAATSHSWRAPIRVDLVMRGM